MRWRLLATRPAIPRACGWRWMMIAPASELHSAVAAFPRCFLPACSLLTHDPLRRDYSCWQGYVQVVSFLCRLHLVADCWLCFIVVHVRTVCSRLPVPACSAEIRGTLRSFTQTRGGTLVRLFLEHTRMHSLVVADAKARISLSTTAGNT